SAEAPKQSYGSGPAAPPHVELLRFHPRQALRAEPRALAREHLEEARRSSSDRCRRDHKLVCEKARHCARPPLARARAAFLESTIPPGARRGRSDPRADPPCAEQPFRPLVQAE